MPKVAENLFSTGASLKTQLRRTNPRSESNDSFQKVLESSRPRSEPAEEPQKPKSTEKPPVAGKRSTRPKKADPANRKLRTERVSSDDVEQPDSTDSTDAPPDASVPTPADLEGTPQPEDATPQETKHSTETAPQQPDAPLDPAAAAILASQQIAPQQSAVVEKTDSTSEATETAEDVSDVASPPKPIVKPLVAEAAGDDTSPTSKAEKTATSELPVAAVAHPSDSENEQASSEEARDPSPAQQAQDDPADKTATPVSSQIAPQQRKVAALTDDAPAPVAKHTDADVDPSQEAAAAASAGFDTLSEVSDQPASDSSTDDAPHRAAPLTSTTDTLNASIEPATAAKISAPDAKPAPAPQPSQLPPEAEFATTNHDRIVTSLRSQLLPNGGTMHMRLDPPELGVLQVTVRTQDGVMTASFETSSDQATKLLRHSLGQLKAVLESQGVTVEKLHVQQSPRDQQAGNNSEDRQQQQSQQDSQSSARQEQQRREMLRRMWSRLGIGSDPLDLVA